jgi:phage terminase large subunit
VFVIHRRFGKTVWAVNDLIRDILTCDLPNPRGGYICPTYKQAKAVAWDYLKQYTEVIPGMKYNNQELKAEFPNGGRISMLGSENADALRGIYLDSAVLDETAQVNPVAWTQVIRPALADRNGRCTFIGTPKGRGNLFSDLFLGVTEYGDDWTRQLLTFNDTGIIPDAEIISLHR